MATVLDTLQKGTGYLEKHGVEDARLNMQHLIAHTLKCDRMQVYVNFDRDLSETQLEILRDLTRRRARGEPLQHLLGDVPFCGFTFRSDRRALIPRQETEELTERCARLDLPLGARILDLGCGCGVIGLSLAGLLAPKNPEVTLSDISPEALSLAEENRDSLGLTDRVALVQSDLFSSITGRFHLIVSNPPYISRSEETSLSREVRNDPEIALYGGESGTEIIAALLASAGQHLEPGGLIALEFGIGQDETVAGLAGDAGFEKIRVEPDLCGVKRFLFAIWGS